MSTKEQKKKARDLLRTTNPKALQDKYRRQNLKHFFGITPEEYDRMLENQKGLCGICEKHSSNFSRRLAVDHCHHTGAVRGLLCASCNSGLGKLQDSVDYLESAIIYLTKPRKVVKTPDVPEVT